jgi:hypothetical protein
MPPSVAAAAAGNLLQTLALLVLLHLYGMLCRYHPSIIGTHVTKELHFFDKQPIRTQTPLYQKQYFASFPGVDMSVDDPLAGKCSLPAQLGLSSSSRPALVRMEATAMYLAHPSAAANVQRLLPQVRLHNQQKQQQQCHKVLHHGAAAQFQRCTSSITEQWASNRPL